MVLFSCTLFNRALLCASRMTRTHLPRKHMRTNGTGRNGMSLGPKLGEAPRQSGLMGGFMKSCAFTAAFGCATYAGASVWQYENRKSLQWRHQSTPDWLRYGVRKRFDLRSDINAWWNGLTEGQKACSFIIALNAAVFCAWKYSPLKPFMVRYFCVSPVSKSVCLPLLLANFSHMNFMHITFNMFALWSFSSSITRELGTEQFVGFYLFAGVFGCLVSNFLKIAKGTVGLSLGASGAIMGVLGYFCMTNPDARLALVFLPMYDFSAATAVKCIMALDATGLVLGWKLFDHAAHLGGVAFGILYAYFGYQYLWRHRHIVIKKWKQLTEPTDK